MLNDEPERAAAIGQRIGWVRDAVGDSQSDMARVLCVNPSTVNKIEAGTRVPLVFFLISVANHYRMPVEFLVTGWLTDLEHHPIRLNHLIG